MKNKHIELHYLQKVFLLGLAFHGKSTANTPMMESIENLFPITWKYYNLTIIITHDEIKLVAPTLISLFLT
jgi:hypothetical protein